VTAADAPEGACGLRIGDDVDAGAKQGSEFRAEYDVFWPEPGVPAFWLPTTP